LTTCTELLKKIRNEKAISDALAGELKTALTEFKPTFQVGAPDAPKPAQPK